MKKNKNPSELHDDVFKGQLVPSGSLYSPDVPAAECFIIDKFT